MCELFHNPARSLTDVKGKRHADMGTARQTKKVKDQSVVRAMLIAVKVRLSISVEQI